MGFKRLLARNFRQPAGLLGKLVGIIMNKGNNFMNRFTINLLDPQNNDRILEIGFGNGKYINELAQKTRNGLIAGVDFSETMVAQARKRNKSFIAQGLVDIKLGEVSKLPFENDTFNKVFTVNTIYFWPDPETDLKEIYRVLKPDGKLIVTFRSKERMEKLELTKHGFKLYEPKEAVQFVSHAGFKNVSVNSANDRNLDVYCLIAFK